MNESPHTLKETILERITAEQMRPVPKVWFTTRECLVWILWAVSITIGALATAVIIYVSVYTSTALVEATHAHAMWFYIAFLPYAWLATFILMCLLAHFNVRHTKRGYRYPLWQIIASSLGFSLVGGSMLYLVGAGFTIDTELDTYMPMYHSQANIELSLWQQPGEGRLVGNLDRVVTSHHTVSVVDAEGTVWTLNITELHEPDEAVLLSGKQVRILGMASSTPHLFHACGVFPWMFEKAIGYSELRAEREEFLQRMFAHHEAVEQIEELEAVTYARREDNMGPCSKMSVVERVSKIMP